MTRWWKCDLQVATPGEPGFKPPSSGPWDLTTPTGQAAAADRYITKAKERGMEVLVLADHNSADWAGEMVAAGRRGGVRVFPGLEVTTSSGSDGAHLIIFGSQEKTRDDFTKLLAGPCGFKHDHPTHQPNGTPAAAPHTLPQILDQLPEDFLAIAPHAFNDNGIASKNTIEGDLRWKALHHARLGAIDVGDASKVKSASSWRARFIRRELDNFPCLLSLAFVSTSDAYCLDDIGRQFTWIRMKDPSIEGFRQAFLDHDARIACDWDQRYQHATPNDIGHAWVRDVTITDATITPEPIEVHFDPRLNVIIGGRGAGKSTIVAALRSLYGDLQGLPDQAQAEATRFVAGVFGGAQIQGSHALPHSGEVQHAHWSVSSGSQTDRSDGRSTTTDFKVRVLNQKELFERSATSTGDPHVTSRNLLNLVDDALASGSSGPGSPAAFREAVDEARTAWVAAARRHEAEVAAVAARPLVAERVKELKRQVAAFDNEANRTRRQRNDQRLTEAAWFEEVLGETATTLDGLDVAIAASLPQGALYPPAPVGEASPDSDLSDLASELSQVRDRLSSQLGSAISSARGSIGDLTQRRDASPWNSRILEAQADQQRYLEELAALGLDPNAYERVRAQLADQVRVMTDLNRRADKLAELEQNAVDAWSATVALLTARRSDRVQLLESVAERSGMLRFNLEPAADETAWVRQVREMLGLRADGFLDEVPALARWLWKDEPGDSAERLVLWRRACLTGDFGEIAKAARMRPGWVTRLSNLDPLVRARLAAELPDDTVSMEFLRERGDPSENEEWQALTAGSPGQRSAAMLSFVLHHGSEPLVLDQPEDDLDTEWITELVVRQLRTSRWTRQLIIVTHNANIPVNADAEQTIVLENTGAGIRIRRTVEAGAEDPHLHCGPLEDRRVRADIQKIMEGGVEAFVRRERRYNNELNTYRAALQHAQSGATS